MKSKIDFVITWVDGNDPRWQKEKRKYEPIGDDSGNTADRYRDWGCLKYFFRGVEKYATWVNKVFFITCGQKPDWLNTEHKKLVCVTHNDFIPKEHLPTFNSNAIQVNLHRINDLSENFVLFDDDVFIINKVRPVDFFYHGLPCNSAVMSPIITTDKNDRFPQIALNNLGVINSHFKKNVEFKRNPFKWINPKYKTHLIKTLCMLPWSYFPGFREGHISNSLRKSTIRKIWNMEYDIMNKTSGSKFRNNAYDINHWLFSEWDIASGNFHPRDIDFGKYFCYGKDSKAIYAAIRNSRYKVVCLNDSGNRCDFEKEKARTVKVFDAKFPKKSGFEL